MMRLISAFIFIVRNETYAVNAAMLQFRVEREKGWADADQHIVWEAVTSVLSHSANLSKVFWPTHKGVEYRARGQIMRSLFDVTDDSPLHERGVRNGFEHLDERLHQWLDEEKTGSIIDQVVGANQDGHWDEQFENDYLLRTCDIDSGWVTAGPVSANLWALSRETDRLYEIWRELEGKPPHLSVDTSR